MDDWDRSRLVVLNFSIAGAMLLVNGLWLSLSSLSIDPGLLLDTATTLSLIAIVALCLGLMRRQLRKTPFRYRELLSEAGQRGQSFAVALLFIATFTFGLLVLSYLATATSRPFMDPHLAAIDAMLGFNWQAYVGFFNRRPLLAKALLEAYGSLPFQMMAVPFCLAMFRKRESALAFCAAYGLAGLLTCAGLLALPAVDAYVFYNPPPDIVSSFTRGAGTIHLNQLYALRSLDPFVLTHPEGLVTFPSFHTTLALLFVYFMRRPWYLAVPFWSLNLLLLLSTPPVGGHYLVDVLAGAGIAVISIQLVRHIAGRSSILSPAAEHP